MKKVILALAVVMILGAGCNLPSLKTDEPRTVEGAWSLAFDLPSGWVMTVPYYSPTTEAVVPSQAVDRTDSEVILQSTDKAIVRGGVGPDAEVSADSYVNLDGNLHIGVSRLDPRRVVPSEAEDLGDGFFRVKVCEEGEDCQLGNRHNYDYYLQTDAANYKFVIHGDDIEQAEDIIMSAEVVTVTEDAADDAS